MLTEHDRKMMAHWNEHNIYLALSDVRAGRFFDDEVEEILQLCLALSGHVRSLEKMLTAHPPAGYDVYCAQDAPAFAVWERVAWTKNELKFPHDQLFVESIDGSLFDDTIDSVAWDGKDMVVIRIPDKGGKWEGLRRYRILPAGSPPPGNEVSK